MRCKYIGDANRYYPSLGITPVPGNFYDLDRDPADGLWVVMDDAHAVASAGSEDVTNA